MQDQNGVYKIGIWLRDSAQGNQTMTFWMKSFILEHLDMESTIQIREELLQLGSGLLYHTEIVQSERGERNTGNLQESLNISRSRSPGSL